MTEDVRELAEDVGDERAVERGRRQRHGDARRALRRPLARARAGQAVEVAVDTRSLHFFDPRDGSRDLRRNSARKETHDAHTHRGRRRDRGSGARAARRRRSAGAGDERRNAPATRTSPSRARSPSTGSGPASSRPDAVRRRDQGLQQDVPERQGQLQAGRQQPADGARDRGRRRPSARHGGHRPAGHVAQLAAAGQAEADHVREVGDRANFAPAWQQLGTFSGKLYALVFKAANKSLRLVQRARLQDGGRDAAEDVGAAAHGRARRSRRRARRRTRSAAPTAGRSPTCSRTSICARSARRSTTRCRPAQDQVDRSVGDRRR